jgi:hypothetical protein
MLVRTWTLVSVEKRPSGVFYEAKYLDGYGKQMELLFAARDELDALNQWRKYAERYHDYEDEFDRTHAAKHEATAEDTNKPCADA